ncbi:MAG: hypothetical protein H0U10_06880 [Chloroflexia bacterium]|nr:hypothetical protein [Chloroflexia bacterium]
MDPRPRQKVGDTVLGVVDRVQLPAVLAEIHRAGFGSVARVFDPRRSEVGAQLRRVGLPQPPELDANDPAVLILAVTAPGRAARAAEAMERGGAHRVYVTVPDEHTPLSPLHATETAPDAGL